MEGPNPLEELPALRRALYRVVWVVGVLTTCVQIGIATVPDDVAVPAWLKTAVAVSLAIVAYLGIFTNYTADKNVGQANDVQRALGKEKVDETPVAERVKPDPEWGDAPGDREPPF